jgi:hypothetical protein
MSYVHVTLANVIDSPEVGRPTALTLRTGGTRLWWDGITDAELAECGWFKVALVARPADTPTTTTDRSVVWSLSGPTELWTSRAKTQAELDAERDQANGVTIRSQADAALTANRTFLAIATPTNVQLSAQVRALTQQMNGVIRVAVLGKLDGTN